MSASETPTPLTDAEADNASLCDQCVPADFARDLERKLAESERLLRIAIEQRDGLAREDIPALEAKLTEVTRERDEANARIKAYEPALAVAIERDDALEKLKVARDALKAIAESEVCADDAHSCDRFKFSGRANSSLQRIVRPL